MHRQSQEMAGDNPPQSLGSSVLSLTRGCASVVRIYSRKELCFWAPANRGRLWTLGYSNSFWCPVVVQLLKAWVRPCVLVTVGVDDSSVSMGNFSSCKLGWKRTFFAMRSCFAKEKDKTRCLRKLTGITVSAVTGFSLANQHWLIPTPMPWRSALSWTVRAGVGAVL